MADDEWDLARNDRSSRFSNAGMGAVRVALLFGSAAIALALIAVPMLDGEPRSYSAQSGTLPEGVDPVSTGSIGYGGRYTLRKSVLQPSPDSVCVIRDNGMRSGDC